MDTSGQPDSKSALKKSTGGLDSWPYSSTTSTSDANSSAKTLIKYEIDETLYIKEEIIEVPDTITVQKQNKTYDSKLCTVRIREEDMLSVKRKLLALKKQKITESKEEIKYTCKKCARTYNLKRHLKRHLKYECDVRPRFRCEFCGKLFKWKYVMNSHVDRVHHKKISKNSVVGYKCDKCSKSYNCLKSLNNHKYLVHSAVKKEYICDYCKYKSNRKSSLEIHITLCHLEAKKQLLCNYCQYKSNWKSNLVKHVISCHLQGKKTIHFDYCEYKSNGESRLIKYITSRHLQPKKKFICDYCAHVSNRKSHLTQHISARHLQAKKPIGIDYCEYKSNSKSNYVKHITSRYSQALKSRHKCDKCSRSYIWGHGLARHKREAHSAVKIQFICDYCAYETNRKSQLAQHISSRHLRTKKQLICDYCQYKLNRKSSLIRHIILSHSQALECWHKCDECSRSYNWLQSLNRHKREVHTAVKKQFICDYCEYKSNGKCYLIKHITSLHLQELKSRYKCDKCARSYNWLTSLSRHKRLLHPLVKPQLI